MKYLPKTSHKSEEKSKIKKSPNDNEKLFEEILERLKVTEKDLKELKESS